MIAPNFRALAKDGFVLGIANLLFSLKGFLLLPLLSKGFGIEAYGVWSQLMAGLEIFMPLLILGLPTALLKVIPVLMDGRKRRRLFLHSLLLTLILSALLASVLFLTRATWLATFFNVSDPLLNAKLSELAKFFIVLLPLSVSFQLCMAFLRAKQQVRKFVIFNVLEIYGTISFAAWIVWQHGDLVHLAMLMCFWRAALVGAMLIFHLKMDLAGETRESANLSSLLKVSLPLTLSEISYLSLMLIDRFFIGFYYPIEEVARYSAVYTIGQMIAFFFAPVSWFLLQQLSPLWERKNAEDFQKLLRMTIKYPLLFAIPLILSSQTLVLPFLVFLTGKIFSVSTIVVLLILASFLFSQLSNFPTNILILAQKTKLVFYANGIAALFNLLLNILLIPRYAIFGAAVSTFLAFGAKLVLLVFLSMPYHRVPLQPFNMLRMVLAAGLILLVFGRMPWIMQLVAFLTVYPILLFVFGVISRAEIRFWKSWFQTQKWVNS